MRLLFGDTSYFVARFNPRDPLHFLAQRYQRQSEAIVTTGIVVTEFLNTFAAGFRRTRAAEEVEDWLTLPGMRIVDLDRQLLVRAVELFKSRQDKLWGLADCASFVVMDDLGIRQALTADHHFVQAGFEALLPVVK